MFKYVSSLKVIVQNYLYRPFSFADVGTNSYLLPCISQKHVKLHVLLIFWQGHKKTEMQGASGIRKISERI